MQATIHLRPFVLILDAFEIPDDDESVLLLGVLDYLSANLVESVVNPTSLAILGGHECIVCLLLLESSTE